tara:strand:+ start:2061 stop:2252 length:192 start_codon:yes stop_codon:yes gene_type:complete
MKELQEQREELEKRLSRLEDAHAKKGYWGSESAYRDSCKVIDEVYKQLFDVCLELGDPIPVRF